MAHMFGLAAKVLQAVAQAGERGKGRVEDLNLRDLGLAGIRHGHVFASASQEEDGAFPAAQAGQGGQPDPRC